MEKEPVPMIVKIECPEHGLLGIIDSRLAKGIIEKHLLMTECESISISMADEQMPMFDLDISTAIPKEVRNN